MLENTITEDLHAAVLSSEKLCETMRAMPLLDIDVDDDGHELAQFIVVYVVPFDTALVKTWHLLKEVRKKCHGESITKRVNSYKNYFEAEWHKWASTSMRLVLVAVETALVGNGRHTVDGEEQPFDLRILECLFFDVHICRYFGETEVCFRSWVRI